VRAIASSSPPHRRTATRHGGACWCKACREAPATSSPCGTRRVARRVVRRALAVRWSYVRHGGTAPSSSHATWARTVVVGAHRAGGREWWAYAPRRIDDGDNSMHRAGLACRDLREVAISILAMCDFVAIVAARYDEVVLFGSSQGATLAAHVAAMMAAGTALQVPTFALQPAGLYDTLWSIPPNLDVVVERRRGFAHGDLSQWQDAQRGWDWPGKGVSLVLSTSRADVVAPEACVLDALCHDRPRQRATRTDHTAMIRRVMTAGADVTALVIARIRETG
jgi:pimeloyl-ACP methyl ester carboxylesterase